MDLANWLPWKVTASPLLDAATAESTKKSVRKAVAESMEHCSDLIPFFAKFSKNKKIENYN